MGDLAPQRKTQLSFMEDDALNTFARGNSRQAFQPRLACFPSHTLGFSGGCASALAFGIMSRVTTEPHRSLYFVLFGIFELLLLVSVVVIWNVDPRRMTGLDDVAGITFGFSFLGISLISWLLRRTQPPVWPKLAY